MNEENNKEEEQFDPFRDLLFDFGKRAATTEGLKEQPANVVATCIINDYFDKLIEQRLTVIDDLIAEKYRKGKLKKFYGQIKAVKIQMKAKVVEEFNRKQQETLNLIADRIRKCENEKS